MRIFIAVNFDKEIKNYIKGIQSKLKMYVTSGNFSRTENLHLTLKFIGEIDKNKIQKINLELIKYLKDIKTFNINISDLGCFNKRDKKIIWLGIKDNDNMLDDLVSDIDKAVSLFGFKHDNRKYNPHITLVRQAVLKNDFNYVKNTINMEYKAISVSKVDIMESKRINGLLTYRPLYTIPLVD